MPSEWEVQNMTDEERVEACANAVCEVMNDLQDQYDCIIKIDDKGLNCQDRKSWKEEQALKLLLDSNIHFELLIKPLLQ